MASTTPPTSLLEQPVTLETMLDLAHHITADFLFDGVEMLLPFFGGYTPDRGLHVIQSNAPLCTLEFLQTAQQLFRQLGVQAYCYVTPTAIVEQPTDPVLQRFLRDHDLPPEGLLRPAICTLVVDDKHAIVRYTTFENSQMVVIAQHLYRKPEHFKGPFSQLLTDTELSQPRPIQANLSLH